MASATRGVQKLRSLLAGAEYNISLRYTVSQQSRTQPPANLPFGAAHYLSANHYVERDGRRAHAPPTTVKPTVSLLAGKKSNTDSAVATFKPSTPGDVFRCT